MKGILPACPRCQNRPHNPEQPYCRPCLAEIDRLTRIEQVLRDKDAQLVSRSGKPRGTRRYPPGCTVDPCLFSYVWTRDSGICAICDRPVDLLLDPFEFGAASLDHVLPLSMGGHHTYDNLQIAHRICNCRKNGYAIHGKRNLLGIDEETGDMPWCDWVRGGGPAWREDA